MIRALFLPVLVVFATLPIGAALGPAGADQLTDLQSKAAAISHDLVLKQLQVDAAQQQSSVAAGRVAGDQQAIAELSQQIAVDQQSIERHLHIVQARAIQTYVNSGSNSSGGSAALFQGNTASAQVASEYASLAVGTITTDLAQLHTAQHALVARQSALQARQRQDRADEAQRAAALGQASAAAAQLRSKQSQVTGQLASAVATQQAMQATAVAVAVASAHKVAPPSASTMATIPTAHSGPTASSGATAVSGPAPTPVSSGTAYPSLSDPALNAFLSCVVQAESGGNYGIVSPNGLYMGAFQFSQSTWNSAAQAAGLSLLVGVPPNQATRAEQDTVAVALFALDGQQPWLGNRCS